MGVNHGCTHTIIRYITCSRSIKDGKEKGTKNKRNQVVKALWFHVTMTLVGIMHLK